MVWDWIVANSNWIFSGVGVSLLVGICGFFINRKAKSRVNKIKSGEKSVIFQDVKESKIQTGDSLVAVDGAIAIKGNSEIQIHQNNYGITSTEARQIAIDVFRANFYQLSEEAGKVARERADELTNEFLRRVEESIPEKLQKMKQPDMQYALYTAQKEFARSGDAEMSELLVDLLVDRINSDDRTLKQIVLNESLQMVSKITKHQLNILSIVLLIRQSEIKVKLNEGSLWVFIDRFYRPFVYDLSKHASDYQHLEYCSCGKIELAGFVDLEQIFRKEFPSVFNNSFKGSVKSYLIDLHPCMKTLFDVWENSFLRSFSLTSVGIALGSANIHKTTKDKLDLSIWIKD